MVALLRTQLGKAIVDELRQIVDQFGLAEHFQRRLRIREYLRVVVVHVDDLLAMIEIEQRRQRAHALAHVLEVTGEIHHAVEKWLGKEMGIRVDAHGQVSGLLAWRGATSDRTRWAEVVSL